MHSSAMVHEGTDPAKMALLITNDLPSFINHRLHIVKRLQAEGYQVSLLGGGSADWALEQAFDFDIEWVQVDRTRFNPIADTKLIIKIAQAISRLRPKVVHATTVKPIIAAKLALLLSLRKADQPGLILSLAGLGRAFADNNALWHRVRRAIIVAVLNIPGPGLREIITVENAADEPILRSQGLARRASVRNTNGVGINFDAFAPQQKTGPLKILFAGRLLRSKGAALYLDAVEKIAHQYPNARFSIAGPIHPDDADCIVPADIGRLTRHANFLNQGDLATKAMPALLAKTDLIVLPTTYGEGLPRVLMEGAAAGCSFITTPQPGWVGIVGAQPDSGWFLQTPTVDCLAQSMEAAIMDPDEVRRRGQRARQAALSAPISEHDVQERFLAIYGSLTEEA